MMAQRAFQLLQSFSDLPRIPKAPVLIFERDQLAARIDTGIGASMVKKHEREERPGLRLLRQQLVQGPPRRIASAARSVLTRSPTVAA